MFSKIIDLGKHTQFTHLLLCSLRVLRSIGISTWKPVKPMLSEHLNSDFVIQISGLKNWNEINITGRTKFSFKYSLNYKPYMFFYILHW